MDKQQIIQIINDHPEMDKETLHSQALAAGIDEVTFQSAWDEVKGVTGQTPPSSGESEKKPAAYDPGWYLFIGLFLTVIPIFIMSYHNSKIFPSGGEVWKKVKIIMWLFIALLVGNFAVLIWATVVISNYLYAHPDLLFEASYKSMFMGQDINSLLSKIAQQSSEITGAIAIIKNTQAITFVLSLIFLILILNFTKKKEETAFKEMRKAGQIERKNVLPPVIIGLIAAALLYFGTSYVVPKVAGLFINQNQQVEEEVDVDEEAKKAQDMLEEAESLAAEEDETVEEIADELTEESETVEQKNPSLSGIPSTPTDTTESNEFIDCGIREECLIKAFLEDCKSAKARINNFLEWEIGDIDADTCYAKQISTGTGEQNVYCTIKKEDIQRLADLDSPAMSTVYQLPGTECEF